MKNLNQNIMRVIQIIFIQFLLQKYFFCLAKVQPKIIKTKNTFKSSFNSSHGIYLRNLEEDNETTTSCEKNCSLCTDSDLRCLECDKEAEFLNYENLKECESKEEKNFRKKLVPSVTYSKLKDSVFIDFDCKITERNESILKSDLILSGPISPEQLEELMTIESFNYLSNKNGLILKLDFKKEFESIVLNLKLKFINTIECIRGPEMSDYLKDSVIEIPRIYNKENESLENMIEFFSNLITWLVLIIQFLLFFLRKYEGMYNLLRNLQILQKLRYVNTEHPSNFILFINDLNKNLLTVLPNFLYTEDKSCNTAMRYLEFDFDCAIINNIGSQISFMAIVLMFKLIINIIMTILKKKMLEHLKLKRTLANISNLKLGNLQPNIDNSMIVSRRRARPNPLQKKDSFSSNKSDVGLMAKKTSHESLEDQEFKSTKLYKIYAFLHYINKFISLECIFFFLASQSIDILVAAWVNLYLHENQSTFITLNFLFSILVTWFYIFLSFLAVLKAYNLEVNGKNKDTANWAFLIKNTKEDKSLGQLRYMPNISLISDIIFSAIIVFTLRQAFTQLMIILAVQTIYFIIFIRSRPYKRFSWNFILLVTQVCLIFISILLAILEYYKLKFSFKIRYLIIGNLIVILCAIIVILGLFNALLSVCDYCREIYNSKASIRKIHSVEWEKKKTSILRKKAERDARIIEFKRRKGIEVIKRMKDE